MSRIVAEHTREGAPRRPAPVFAGTRPEEVFGCLDSGTAPRTLEEMQAGVLTEAMRRHLELRAASVRMPLHQP